MPTRLVAVGNGEMWELSQAARLDRSLSLIPPTRAVGARYGFRQ